MNHDPKLGLHDTYYANSCFLSSIPKDYAYITNRIRIKKIRNMIGTKIIFLNPGLVED